MYKRKYRIGIYDISASHFTVLNNLIKIFSDQYRFEIFLFISEKQYKELSEVNVSQVNHITLKINSNRYKTFLFNLKVSTFSTKLDVLIVNSLKRDRVDLLSHMFLKPRCKYILIDSLYGDTYLRCFNKFNHGKITNYFAYRVYQHQLDSADKLIYHSRPVIDALKKFTDKTMEFLPFGLWEENYKKNRGKSDKKIVFTIIGGAEEFRRDYNVVFNAVNIIANKYPYILDNFQIVFLGTPKYDCNYYGQSILKKAANINSSFNKDIFIFFYNYIPEKIYREYIARTDVIINPLVLSYYPLGGFCSGMAESISHAIPGIYPDGYSIVIELASSSEFYNTTDELAEIIFRLVSTNKIESLNNLAMENSKKFDLNIQKDRLINFILN